MILFGKTFVFKFLSLGGPKMGPVRGFSSFVKNQCMVLFRSFCMKLWQHKGLQLPQMIFCVKNLVLEFLDKKWTQNEFCEFYKKSVHWIFLFVCSCSNWQYFLIESLFLDFWDRKPKIGAEWGFLSSMVNGSLYECLYFLHDVIPL